MTKKIGRDSDVATFRVFRETGRPTKREATILGKITTSRNGMNGYESLPFVMICSFGFMFCFYCMLLKPIFNRI